MTRRIQPASRRTAKTSRAAAGGGARPSTVRARPAGRAAPRREAAPSEPTSPLLEFWSRDWVQAAKDAWNAGPSDEVKGRKIPRFWEWIDKAKQYVNCQLALAVEGLPGAGARDCLLLDLAAGRAVRARLASRDDAEASATYILKGSYQDWREIMGGFDMGKAVMYRKLLLEKGEVLEFFKSIYFWTESLACVQRIPTSFPVVSGRVN